MRRTTASSWNIGEINFLTKWSCLEENLHHFTSTGTTTERSLQTLNFTCKCSFVSPSILQRTPGTRKHLHYSVLYEIGIQKCQDKMAEHKGVCLDILKFCTAMVKTSITICWSWLSNQSFYRQMASCGLGVGDHRVGQWRKGVMGQQNSCKTLIGVYSTMHLMHPN